MYAGGAGANHVLHQFEGIEIATESGLGVGHDRCDPVDAVVTVERVNLVCPQECVIDSFDHFRHGVNGIQALVGIHLSGAVSIASDLPAGTVNCLEACLNFLDRLVAGQGAQRTNGLVLIDQSP